MTLLSKLLAPAVTALLISAPAFAQTASTPTKPPARIIDFALTEAEDDHTIGSETAALTLIIWASVTCPHCGNWFSDEWPKVKSELVETDKLRVVFREYPTQPADMAMTGFRLAECAPSADYVSLIEHQMQNQKAIYDSVRAGTAQKTYTDIARKAGMADNAAIAACLNNPDITAHIVNNAQRADVANIRGVPAFLINGEIYEGEQDAETLIALIQRMDKDGLSKIPADIEARKTDHSGHNHD